MTNRMIHIISALILSTFLSCERAELPVQDNTDNLPETESNLKHISISATIEQQGSGTDTKTTLGEGNSLQWVEGDSFDLLPVTNGSVKDVLVTTVNGTSQGLGFGVSSTTGYVKYEAIKVTVNGTDVTSSITSTGSTTDNSYAIGVYNTTKKYQYAPAGTSVQASINTDNNTFPLVQSKSSSTISTTNVAVVTLTGIKYSTNNSTWTDINENTTLKNGSEWGKNDVSSYEWQYRSGNNTPDKTTATISSSGAFNAVVSEGYDYYAVYPSSSSTAISEDVLSFSLPKTQTYTEGSFASGANPSVGKLVQSGDDYSVEMKNVCGVIAIKLKGDAIVTSLEITDPTITHNLWGNGSIDVNNIGTEGAIFTGGDNTIILDCGTGVQLSKDSATPFYVVVPVGSFSSGLEITVNTAFGTGTKSTTTSNTIKRSIIKAMPAFSTDRLEYVVPEWLSRLPSILISR